MKRIFLLNPDNTACGYYRSQLPYRHCTPILKKEKIELDCSPSLDWSKEYDVYIFHRMIAPQFLPYLIELRARGKRIVWEIDDNLFDIPEWSGAKGVFRPEDLAALRLCLNWSDEVIVSTEPLKRQLGYASKTTVLPNLVDLRDWPRTRHTEPDDYIRILWAGSNTHQADLQEVVPALKVLAKKHGDLLQYIFFGAAPEELLKLPQTTFVSNVPLKSYADMCQLIRPHIGLCPLVDHPFNLAKSNIKWLEMTLAGAAVVASKIGPYDQIEKNKAGLNIPANASSYIEDGCNMLETNGWEEQLDNLIVYAAKRKEFWKAAKRQVVHEHSWQSDKRELWLSWFRQVVQE